MRHSPAHWSPLAMLIIAWAAVWPAGSPVDASQYRYAEDAHGQPARVTESWDIQGTEWQGIGTINSLVRCGDEAFLADSQSRVRRYDLKHRKPLDDIGVADDEGRLARPAVLAADCAAQLLYVVDGGLRAVLSYRLPSGTFHKKYPLPRTFVLGGSAELVDPGLLYVGGLWFPFQQGPQWSLNALDFDHFFDPLRFGVNVPLESGDVTPGFHGYEDKCVSASSCIKVNLARVKGGGPIAWAIAQAGSEHVGLYAGDGKHLASIDVRSPAFRRSGVSAGPNTPARQYILWRRENSEIDRVFAFGKIIATSHLVADVEPDWDFGPMNYRVHMNLHSLDGTGLVSDISLPGRPVGRDESHIYVVDYSRGGRPPEAKSVRLLRIPIKVGKGGFQRN